MKRRHKSANFPASPLVVLQLPQLEQLQELSQHAPSQEQSLSPTQNVQIKKIQKNKQILFNINTVV